MFCQKYIMLRIQRPAGNSVDQDEVAHHRPPHLNLPCLQTIFISGSFILDNVAHVFLPLSCLFLQVSVQLTPHVSPLFLHVHPTRAKNCKAMTHQFAHMHG